MKTITNGLNNKDIAKVLRKKLGYASFNRLSRIVQREVMEAHVHFYKVGELGGWPLDWGLIENRIFVDFLGIDPGFYILAKFAEAGMKTGFQHTTRSKTMGNFVLTKTSKKRVAKKARK